MALSHYDVIIRSETRLIAALIDGDNESVLKLCHRDIVFTNEVGKSIWGAHNLQVLRPEILKYNTINILDRDVHFFDTVAIVNSKEKRSGTYLSLPFSSEYHLIRVWKFSGKWQLIAAASMMPC